MPGAVRAEQAGDAGAERERDVVDRDDGAVPARDVVEHDRRRRRAGRRVGRGQRSEGRDRHTLICWKRRMEIANEPTIPMAAAAKYATSGSWTKKNSDANGLVEEHGVRAVEDRARAEQRQPVADRRRAEAGDDRGDHAGDDEQGDDPGDRVRPPRRVGRDGHREAAEQERRQQRLGEDRRDRRQVVPEGSRRCPARAGRGRGRGRSAAAAGGSSGQPRSRGSGPACSRSGEAPGRSTATGSRAAGRARTAPAPGRRRTGRGSRRSTAASRSCRSAPATPRRAARWRTRRRGPPGRAPPRSRSTARPRPRSGRSARASNACCGRGRRSSAGCG